MMRIKIKINALDIYIEEHTDNYGNYTGTDRWERIMKKIAGKVLEVDTTMLFKYEYNLKVGIRIEEQYVEKIAGDERKGKARCNFCDSVSESTKVCTHCGRTDYLDPYFEEY